MKLIQIDKQGWTSGLEKLKSTYRVFGPAKEKKEFEFKELGTGQLPELHFQNTRLSPKSIVYPQSQKMFTYSLDETAQDFRILKEIKPNEKPSAVIGIRPCDALAFQLVRRNFDSPEYQDTYWVNAYESTTFLGLACNHPCSTCFCTSAGTGPFGETGLDILLFEKNDAMYANAITHKGEALLQGAGWGQAADKGVENELGAMKSQAESMISSFVKSDAIKQKKIMDLYEAPFWEEEAFSCINCGTCTYVCPTCWCFDIQDETHGKSGVRLRNWDSCMSPLFTIHASGHNPREHKYERVRQRFMHKLKYYVDKYDDGIQCVGCGRCVRMCPVNIDIRNICNRMNSFDPKSCSCEVATS
jgi:sulfhydrogenase subunit beta (sulfur reductase)